MTQNTILLIVGIVVGIIYLYYFYRLYKKLKTFPNHGVLGAGIIIMLAVGVGLYSFVTQGIPYIIDTLQNKNTPVAEQPTEPSIQTGDQQSTTGTNTNTGSTSSSGESLFSGLNANATEEEVVSWSTLKDKLKNVAISERHGATLVNGLPVCKNESLKEYRIYDIDAIIENCTEKVNKEGILLDGLGGGCMRGFNIYNGQITKDKCWGVDKDKPICATEYDSSIYIAYSTKIEDGIDGYNAIKKIIGLGLLDTIAQETYADKLRCKRIKSGDCKLGDLGCGIDPDCNDMKDFEGYIDGNNYFVAGYRNGETGENDKLYYIINGKLFDPGTTKRPNREISKNIYSSKRNFVGFNNKNAIVKKMKDIKVTDEEKGTTTYTLQTCEININNLQ